jgi:NADH pyrophosphatase NudC (nudix superfamily)
MSFDKNKVEFHIRIQVRIGAEFNTIDLIVKRIDAKNIASTFESILTVNEISEVAKWITNDIRPLETYFVVNLQRLLSQYNPEGDQIEVLEDTHSLFLLKSAYCQHCGKKLYETYGQAYGVIKKCPNCGRLSFYRDQK